MGFDIGQLFGQAQQAISQGANDLVNTGGQALVGFAESQAVQLIEGDEKTHEAAAQQATAAIMQRPGGAPSAISSYMQNLLQSPVLKQYGPYMVAGVVAVGVIAVVVFGRK